MGVPHILNLAEESEWRFFQRVLARSGISRDRNPELMRTIENARKNHVEHGGPVLDAPSDDAPIVDQNMYSSIGLNPAGNIPSSSAFSSVVGGTTYTMLYLELLDQNNNPLGSNSITQYGEGENVTVVTQGAQASQAGFQAQFTYSYQKKSGGQPVMGSINLDVTDEPVGPPVLTQPVRTPANVTAGKQYIKVGVGRTGSNAADCDYWYSEPDSNKANPILKVPITATQQFSSNVTAIVQAALSVTSQWGGGITLSSTSQLMNGLSSSGSTLTINFPFNGNPPQDQSATFPAAKWPPDQMTTVTFTIFVKTVNSGNGLVGISIYSSLTPPYTGDQGAPALDGVYVLRPVDFTWHCVAAGTQVKMAGGRTISIDELTGGEEIVINAEGRTLVVNDTYVQQKDGLIISVKDNKGHHALITERHAVITSQGPIIAKYLLSGQTILTDKGSATVTEVQSQPYSGLVYSINVGRGIALANLPDRDKTFFANGILVGDNALSRDVAAHARKQLANILADLPEEWRAEAAVWHAQAAAA